MKPDTKEKLDEVIEFQNFLEALKDCEIPGYQRHENPYIMTFKGEKIIIPRAFGRSLEISTFVSDLNTAITKVVDPMIARCKEESIKLIKEG